LYFHFLTSKAKFHLINLCHHYFFFDICLEEQNIIVLKRRGRWLMKKCFICDQEVIKLNLLNSFKLDYVWRLFCQAVQSDPRKYSQIGLCHFCLEFFTIDHDSLNNNELCPSKLLRGSLKQLELQTLLKYRVIRKDCRGFNNLSYTVHLR